MSASDKPAVVMLLSRHPFAEQSGRAGMLRQRIRQLGERFELRLVAFCAPAGGDIDKNVVFAPMAGPVSLALNALRLAGAPLQTWLYYSGRARTIVAKAMAEAQAKAIYVDMLRLAPVAKRTAGEAALLQDFDDILSERYRRASETKGYKVMGFLSKRMDLLTPIAGLFAKSILKMEARRCARYERRLLARCDLAIMTSPKEAGVFKAMAPEADREKILAAAPTASARTPKAAQGGRLIFLGNLAYGENVLMLRTLANSLASLEAEDAAPDISIDVVGHCDRALASAFDPRRFRFLGRIENLDDLAGQGVFLAPIAGGSGVSIKVLDGMSLGCPVVTTTRGLQGLAARRNRDLIAVEDPAQVLPVAIKLLARPKLQAMLRARALDYVAREHAPEVIDARLADAAAAALDRHARRV